MESQNMDNDDVGNGLLPVWHQAIISTDADLSFIKPSETYCNDILITFQIFWLRIKSNGKWNTDLTFVVLN